MKMQTCPNCGNVLEKGTFRSRGSNYFLPADEKTPIFYTQKAMDKKRAMKYHEFKERKSDEMKKISFLLLIAIFCFSCTSAAFASEPAVKSDPQFADMVNEAIVVLAENWDDFCWDSNNPDKKHMLDIRSTRIICIRDVFDEAQDNFFLSVQEELFGNVQCVIEFLTYVDYMTDGIYTYPMTSDVIIYDDGNMEWARMGNYIDEYRGRTFSNDFSAFIEQVIDLHEEYNQVIRFQNHEVLFEEVQ